MSDLLGKVSSHQDLFKKILGKIPGFSGYVERTNRRASDKLLRDAIAKRYEEQWKRISALQAQMTGPLTIQYIDDIESAAIKLRQFIDRIKTASYGYAGFFDAVKVNEDELAMLYQYDVMLLDLVEDVSRAVDNLEASMGDSEALPATIRNLTAVAQSCVEAFNRRAEAILGDSAEAGASDIVS